MKAIAVTGAAGAIGSAVARACARPGCRVYLLDVNGSGLDRVAGALSEAGRDAVAVPCDVSDAAQVTDAFDRILRAGDELIGLVNSAAVMDCRGHLLDLAAAEWERALRTNLSSVFLCSQAAARQMTKHGGSIVSVGSLSSRRAHREQAAYDAAKGGLEALTRAMALDLAPYAIRANAVLPIAIETTTMVQHPAEEFARKKRLIPLGRYGTPEEVAEVCEFLISRGTYLTGQCIVVDGGLDCQLRPLDLDYTESGRFRDREQS